LVHGATSAAWETLAPRIAASASANKEDLNIAALSRHFVTILWQYTYQRLKTRVFIKGC
jgi:hypothetical protein